jgi:hypothetical protein
MILTQAELLKVSLINGCEPKVLCIQCNVTRVVYRFLCQVEYWNRASCQHLVIESLQAYRRDRLNTMFQ